MTDSLGNSGAGRTTDGDTDRLTRQTKRQIDTDRQKNRWMEQVDRQTNRRINLNC